MIQVDALRLVQGNQRPLEEHEVLLLQRYGEPVDDGAQDLQELADAVVPLRLVDEAVEHVGDCLANERPVAHELPVDAMQDGLQIVPFPRILRVKQLDQI
eukprot:scaffold1350_cov249-Pinguiococcus_pyrenoidosus.AAC.16